MKFYVTPEELLPAHENGSYSMVRYILPTIKFLRFSLVFRARFVVCILSGSCTNCCVGVEGKDLFSVHTKVIRIKYLFHQTFILSDNLQPDIWLLYLHFKRRRDKCEIFALFGFIN